jgi:RND family efflux transporter MFP subunit
MKTIYTVVALSILLVSCKEKKGTSIEEVIATNDIVQIKAKKVEVEIKEQALLVELKKLNDKLEELDTNKKVPLITTLKTEEVVFTHYLELQGNVETKQNILVYPEMPGVLAEILVKEGQQVRKGDVLATVKDGGLSQQLSQLETQRELARTTFERQKRLWSQKIGSEMQYLQAKAQYEAQQKAVEQLKMQLEKSKMRAPFDGIVDDVLKEPGTVIAPGQGSEVFRIVNLSKMYVATEVPERYLANVTKNKEVNIEFPVLGLQVKSVVGQVANFINPSNRSFEIEIPVTNKEGSIKPNLTAKLHINDYTNNNAILIPQSIISENSKGEQFVYVVKNKNTNKEAVAERVVIITGKTQGDMIEVLANLPVGTEVVEEGARSVNNGQTVRVINK